MATHLAAVYDVLPVLRLAQGGRSVANGPLIFFSFAKLLFATTSMCTLLECYMAKTTQYAYRALSLYIYIFLFWFFRRIVCGLQNPTHHICSPCAKLEIDGTVARGR